MLTDHWIIVQLLGLACTAFLMARAAAVAFRIVTRWNADSNSQQQLAMERETYMVSWLLRLCMVFQVLDLMLFLSTVNLHLPGMIKGAMCASGVLSANAWGNPLLGLKLASVLLYMFFFWLNHLDGQAPGYPLTPYQYRYFWPSLPLLLLNLAGTIAFFALLSPNIIATCCSVEFDAAHTYALLPNQDLPWWQAVGGSTLPAFVLALLLQRPSVKPWAVLLATALFAGTSLYALKYFFVKYIYGLPSHACIYDAFLGNYHYVGYAIFGGYLLLAYYTVGICQSKWHTGNVPYTLRRGAWAALLLAWGIPLLYWLFWTGEL